MVRCIRRAVLPAAFALGVAGTGGAQTIEGVKVTGAKAPDQAVVSAEYGKLPLSFEANEGQADPRVRFVSRGSGYSVMLTDTSAVLALTSPARKADGDAKAAATKTDVIRMEFADGRAKAAATGVDRLAGTANYFLGNDAAKWHSNVPTYGKVRYAGVYPGVDLVYYGNQRQLEYDYVVAPHAESRAIRLRFSGAKQLKLSPEGDLRIVGEDGEIAFHKPAVYQEKDGVRQAVPGGFTLLAKDTVGFRVGRYDHKQPLVIDPVLVYSTYFGKGGAVSAIAVDAQGSAYVTGITEASDFPITPGAFQNTPGPIGNGEYVTAFITKFNPAGTALVYSTYLGGQKTSDFTGTYGRAIAVDAAGNAYVAGATGDTDFPLSPEAFQTVNKAAAQGAPTAYVTKLNSSGTSLLYSTYLGGSTSDEAWGLALDKAGNAYVVGTTYSTNFPVSNGALQTTGIGEGSFVTKLNGSGSQLLYSTYMRGARLNAVAVDKDGYAYVIGTSVGNNLQVTPGAFQTELHGAGPSAVVAKLDQTAKSLIYSTYLGGTGTVFDDGNAGDLGLAIALDDVGNAYATGATSSGDFPVTTGAFQTAHEIDNFNFTGFVSKLNISGSALVYSTYLGGNSGSLFDSTFPSGIAVDSDGYAIVAGDTSQVNYPVTQGTFQAVNLSGNGFVTKLNAKGDGLTYSTFLGGFGDGGGNAIALDQKGAVYVGGAVDSDTFPVTPGAYQTARNSAQGYVAKLQLGSTTTPIAVQSSIGMTFTGGYFYRDNFTYVAPNDTRLTITAKVPQYGTAEETGGVRFYISTGFAGPSFLGSGTLSGGAASFTTSFATPATYTVYAVYGGDGVHAGSLTSQELVIEPVPAKFVIVSGTHQSAVIGSQFAEQLAVKLVDRHGNPAAGYRVLFSGCDPSHCGFGYPSYDTGPSGTAITGPDGVAQIYVFAGAHAGPAGYTPTASVNGFAVHFFLVNTKAQATVSLNLLDRVYTGYPLGAFATTNPAGLRVDFNYDGQGGKAPIAVGTHTVVATIDDADYEGSATGTTVIEARK